MADLDAAHQGILPDFGWQQWRGNLAGIGNECTHWIYAALLEARALDFDRALHIQQTHDPFTWGRRIQSPQMIAGDILQFVNFQNRFDFWVNDPSGSTFMTHTFTRGPHHTAMCGVDQSHTFEGQHLVLESHLHQPGYARMTIRENRVYDTNFSISLTAQQFAASRTNGMFPANQDMSDPDALARQPAWLKFRDAFPASDRTVDAAFQKIQRRQDPKLDDVAFLCRLRTTGDRRFYRPQASPARLAMDATAFETEKQRVIAMMIRSGRPGDADTPGHPLDKYDSDNKRARVRDNYFTWQFHQAA